jgi:C-terminal processing protease CtpA/Prc
MSGYTKIVLVLVIAMAVGQTHAQDQEEKITAEVRKAETELLLRTEATEAERRAAEREMERAATEMSRVARERERARSGASRSVEIEGRLREAEQALAAAAQRMAELSMQHLPRVAMVERIVRANRGPVLGITIGDTNDGEPVAGVDVNGVSPGGAAAEAGLRAGDTITSINGESLTANDSEKANQKLLDFMQGVEVGDELEVEFLREGKTQSVTLTPRAMQPGNFAFNFDTENFTVPNVHVAPFGNVNRFVWVTESGGFGDMELVKLTDELGSYFATTEGLLVIRAPENEDLQLKDGDVILNIDGREPTSASHAMRILGSYEAGETLKIEIMRNKRRQAVSIEVPDRLQGQASPTAPPAAMQFVTPARKISPVPPVHR